MITSTRTKVYEVYTSETVPKLETRDKELGVALQWADNHPVVYEICMNNKSAWGQDSNYYLGYERGPETKSTIARIAKFRECCGLSGRGEVGRTRAPNFFSWCARWTMTHYDEAGFKHGRFSQWDGTYDRGVANVDYSPGALDEIVTRFLKWCGPVFQTVEVRLDKSKVYWEPVDRLNFDYSKLGR